MREKPIIQIKGSGGYKYKNCFIGYAANYPIEIETDLTYKQLEFLLEGKYKQQQIEAFERGDSHAIS